MRDLVKKAILASGALRFAGDLHGPAAAILMYHSVLPDPAAQADSLGGIIHSDVEFRAQMELLAREFHPLRLDEIVKRFHEGEDLPKRSVVVTFDDGYADNYEVAMPILDQFSIPAVFYATVDCVENRTLPWPSRLRFAFRRTRRTAWSDPLSKSWNLSDPVARERAYLAACDACCQLCGAAQEEFVQRIEHELETGLPAESGSLMMTYDQLRGLALHGHIVGSHTMTHPNMAQLNQEQAYRELAESKHRLEQQLGMPINHFSYPCPALSPHWSGRTVEQSRALGYETAVTTDSGLARRGDNLLCLKRLRPTKTQSGLRWNLESAFAGRTV